MENRLMIGVDGGGTHTIAVAARSDGTVLGYAKGAGINYNAIGLEKARHNLYALITGMPCVLENGYSRICVGHSALDGPADEATTHSFAGSSFDFSQLDLQSDAFAALMGLTCGKPGLIIICGTGSMLLAVDKEGGQHVMGGWGYILGDMGSSYALAIEGLRTAIDGWEDIGEKTALMDAALSHFQITSPRDLIQAVYAPETTPSIIAQFAKEVLRLNDSDSVATEIISKQMRHIALQAEKLLARYPEIRHIGLSGGIFTHNPSVFAQLKQLLNKTDSALTVAFPTYPPELGALMHLFMQQGMLNDEVRERMQKSYQHKKAGGFSNEGA